MMRPRVKSNVCPTCHRPLVGLVFEAGALFTIDAVAALFGKTNKTIRNMLAANRDRFSWEHRPWKRRQQRRVLLATDLAVLRELLNGGVCQEKKRVPMSRPLGKG